MPRVLAESLIQFAYRVAMPGLLFVTIAQEPAEALFAWRFLLAFGGGSLICFALVFAPLALRGGGAGRSAMIGISASMTNTGFVALPVLRAIYGQPAVLPAAIATVFVAAVMFPLAVVLLEMDGRRPGRRQAGRWRWRGTSCSTRWCYRRCSGWVWAALGLRLPVPVVAYMNIFADALTACALFAIGLGLSIADLRANFAVSSVLTVVKLAVMPAIVLGLGWRWHWTRSS